MKEYSINNKNTYVKTYIDTSIHTYIYKVKEKKYTQEAYYKIRFEPTYKHAFNVYTPIIYIQHTSIHIHAYNVHVSIKIVNTNIEALSEMKAYCIP